MSNIVQMKVRVPTDVKRWLQIQATLNRSSQSSEIVRALRERMTQVDMAEPDDNSKNDQ